MNIGSTEEVVIKIAVCGPPASGKQGLINKLNNRIHTRQADKRSFRLVAAKASQESSRLFSDFDFVLIIHEPVLHSKWKGIAAEVIKKVSGHLERICLVETMVDTVVPDSERNTQIQRLPSAFAHLFQVKFIATSSVTGEGVETVASYIVDQLFPLPPPSKTSLGVGNLILNRILDVVASIFALPIPPNVNQDTEDEEEMDNDIIDPLSMSPECTAWRTEMAKTDPVHFPDADSFAAYRFTPSLIAKARNPLEFDNTVYARSRLNVPIPQPRYPHTGWYVSDFIKGRTLRQCWESLGIFMKFRIACTLRLYISQMRRVTCDKPGSPRDGHVFGHLFSFGYYSGPFATSLEFRNYYEYVTLVGWERAYNTAVLTGVPPCSRPPKPTFPIQDGGSLVFTHADLSPSNMILSDDGTLWIIDWATCGFYPRWMEALGMYRYYREFSKSWERMIWFAVGPRPQHTEAWLKYFLRASDGFSHMSPNHEPYVYRF